MLEHIMGYFGTYTPAADGAIATFQFEYLTTLGFAAIVIFLGRAIVAHSALLRKYAIPAPVISGIIFSVVVSIIKGSGIIGFSFDAKIVKDLCQNLFFLCVGFGFSYKMLKHAGGKLCIAIAVAACVLITLQDVVGYLVGQRHRSSSASGSAVFFLSYVRRCWYCFCIWSYLREHGCSGCNHSRCSSRYYGQHHGFLNRWPGCSFPDFPSRSEI